MFGLPGRLTIEDESMDCESSLGAAGQGEWGAACMGELLTGLRCRVGWSSMHDEKPQMVRITVNPGEKPPRGETDWARVDAMTEEEVLAAAYSDPDAQPLDLETLARMRRVSR